MRDIVRVDNTNSTGIRSKQVPGDATPSAHPTDSGPVPSHPGGRRPGRRRERVPRTVAATAFALVAAQGCSEDTVPTPPGPPASDAVLRVTLRHVAAGTPFELGAEYVNEVGNPYRVSVLRYIVSRLDVVGGDRGDGGPGGRGLGDDRRGEAPAVVVDVARPTTTTFRATVPPGSVDFLTFTLGLGESDNRDPTQGGQWPATPDWEAMRWPAELGGGYHHLMIEGENRTRVDGGDPFDAFHVLVGRIDDGAGPVESFHAEVRAPIGPLDVVAGDTTDVVLDVDVNEWFAHPHAIDLDFVPATRDVRGDRELGADVRDNTPSVFGDRRALVPRARRVPAEYPTLQAAMDAANAGDTVLVADGVFTGPGNVDLNPSRSTTPRPKNLVIRSENGPTSTILDAAAGPSNPHRAFLFQNGEGRDTIVEGFTVRNGWMGTAVGGAAVERRHELSGGAIVFRFAGTAPTIRGCVFETCFSAYSGGALEAEVGAAPLIEDCVFRANVTDNIGGALSLESGSEAIVRRCVFTGNVSGAGGGGISVSAPATFEACLIAGNRAGALDETLGAGVGGGIEVRYPARVTLERTVIWNNAAIDGAPNVFYENLSGMSAVFTCSAVDTLGAIDEGVVYETSLFEDPRFCAPAPPGDAPTSGGDYALSATSPCLPAASPCGRRIGPDTGVCTGAGAAHTGR